MVPRAGFGSFSRQASLQIYSIDVAATSLTLDPAAWLPRQLAHSCQSPLASWNSGGREGRQVEHALQGVHVGQHLRHSLLVHHAACISRFCANGHILDKDEVDVLIPVAQGMAYGNARAL